MSALRIICKHMTSVQYNLMEGLRLHPSFKVCGNRLEPKVFHPANNIGMNHRREKEEGTKMIKKNNLIDKSANI